MKSQDHLTELTGISRLLLIFCSLTILGVLPVQAQSPLSSIVGTVRDASGAVVFGAEVTAVDEGRGFERSVTTNERGDYTLDFLREGSYSVSCELSGFKTYSRSQIPLLVRQVLRIDVTLELGEVTETVTVTGAAPAIETETAVLSSGIGTTTKYLKDVPKNELFFYQVHAFQFSAHYYGYKAPSAHTLQQRLTTEGMDINSARAHLYANYDLQEFKIQYSGAKAESTSPIILDMTLRGGANDFHGAVALEVFYPSLSAIGPNPGSRRPHGASSFINYWNGSGPVYIPKIYDGRDKTFFYLSRMWSTYTELGQSASGVRRNLPPLAWRDGDLSHVDAANFSNPQKALVDPLTGKVFPNNIIPASRISPVSRNIQSTYHLPNNVPPGDRHTLFQNYKIDFGEGHGGQSETGTWTYKVDHNLTDNDTIGVVHHRTPQGQTWDQTAQKLWYELIQGKNTNWSAYWTRVFSPTVVNEFRIGINRATRSFVMDPDPPHPQSWPPNGYTQLKQFGITWAPVGIDDAFVGAPVAVCIPGVHVTGGACGRPRGQQSHGDQRHIINNLAIHRGSHNLKLGFDFRPKYDYSLGASRTPRALFGRFEFSGRFTGFPYGDFLLGLPDSSSRAEITPRPYRIQRWGSAYFQDDWKVIPNLTLELGLRMEHIGLAHEKNSMMVTFDPTTRSFVVPNNRSLALVSPLFPQDVYPILTAEEAGYPDQLRSRPQPTFYPRFGFGYRPFGGAKTVVRGGYGSFLVPATLGSSLVSTSPYALSESFRNDIVNGQPAFSFPFGFPTESGDVPGQSAFGVAKEFPYAYTQNWNLSLEREVFADTSVRASYIGSRTTQMPYQRAINKPAPSLLPYDNNCASQPAGTCVGPVFPGFGTVNVAEAGGNGNYHGLELEFKRRWAKGLAFSVDYSFSKGISDVDDQVFPGGGDYGNFIENPYDRARDRGRNFASVPHRLLITKVWDIPVGEGRRFLGDVSGIGGYVLDKAIGGWTFSSIWNWTGRIGVTPFWVGADTSHTNTPIARADVIPGCNPTLANATLERRYNRECFAQPPEGRFGNAGRSSFWTRSGVRNAGDIKVTNFGLYKYTRITPRTKGGESGLQLRVGFKLINAFNHPIDASLVSGFGQGTFGNNGVRVNVPFSERGNKYGRRTVYIDMGLEF